MQPRSGGFWRPDTADDDAIAVSDQQTELNQQEQPADYPSVYDGYELTEPDTAVKHVPNEVTEVQWEASEYIQHEKDMGWFVILLAIAIVLFGLALLFNQWTFAALVIAMTAAIITYARRPPQILHYKVDLSGFSIENKRYPYSDFKAFGITQDGPLHMITLLPRKRFSPPVSMYFEEKDGEQIVDLLGSHLPLQPLERDKFDELVRKLRF